jgi:hypothetical protein
MESIRIYSFALTPAQIVAEMRGDAISSARNLGGGQRPSVCPVVRSRRPGTPIGRCGPWHARRRGRPRRLAISRTAARAGKQRRGGRVALRRRCPQSASIHRLDAAAGRSGRRSVSCGVSASQDVSLMRTGMEGSGAPCQCSAPACCRTALGRDAANACFLCTV